MKPSLSDSSLSGLADSYKQFEAKKDAYKVASNLFLAEAKNGISDTSKDALENWHSAGIDFFNSYESFLATACLCGADRDAVYFSDKIDTAIGLLGVILKHYTLSQRKAEEYGLGKSRLPSSTAFATMQRLVMEARPDEGRRLKGDFLAAGLPVDGFQRPAMARRLSSWEKKFAAASGTGFLVLILILVLFVPDPSAFQALVFRVVLSLSAGAFATVIGGYLDIEAKGLKWGLRAGSGFAVFVVIYFINPPAILSQAPDHTTTTQPASK